MRQVHGWFLLLLAGSMVVGCGNTSTPTSPPTPLTQEEWKQLPPSEKYEIATLERLKQGDATLMEPRAWEKFNRTVLLPSKRKDGVK